SDGLSTRDQVILYETERTGRTGSPYRTCDGHSISGHRRDGRRLTTGRKLRKIVDPHGGGRHSRGRNGLGFRYSSFRLSPTLRFRGRFRAFGLGCNWDDQYQGRYSISKDTEKRGVLVNETNRRTFSTFGGFTFKTLFIEE